MVMEVALAFVQPHSYTQVTNLVLLSLSLSLPLHTYLHLLGIPVPASSLASSYSSLKDEAQILALLRSLFPDLPGWISFSASIIPYHPA